MFSTFFLTISEVVKTITLSDLLRAFGDETMSLYYQSNPEVIKAFMQMFKISQH